MDATLHNHRSDSASYPAYSQELPAVYANAPYYRLMSSAGGSVVEYDAGWNASAAFPWLPGAFTADEGWAALVDDTGYGVGVVMLGTSDFIGGFAGDKGEGGPSDSSTGYMAPVAMVTLPPDGTYAYTFYLVLGDVDTIRAYAQQVQAEAESEAPPAAKHPEAPLSHFPRRRPDSHQKAA